MKKTEDVSPPCIICYSIAPFRGMGKPNSLPFCHPDRAKRAEGSLNGIGGSEPLSHGKSFCIQRSFALLRMTSLSRKGGADANEPSLSGKSADIRKYSLLKDVSFFVKTRILSRASLFRFLFLFTEEKKERRKV